MSESCETVTPVRAWNNRNLQRVKSFEQRFWEKVDKNGPIPPHVPELGNCWEWFGYVNKVGYGIFDYKKKKLQAHRVSWEFHFGEIKNNLFACHKCDNRKCCNPNHLFLGTQQDNIQDMMDKGRHALGKTIGSKITAVDVVEIRRLSGMGVLGRHIAKQYSLSEASISLIIHRINWKYVE